MKPKRLNGYWTAKDGSCYIFVEKVFKAGHVTGFRYFRIDGREVIDMNPFKVSQEELVRDYEKGMKD
jgi:hypothetical protein